MFPTWKAIQHPLFYAVGASRALLALFELWGVWRVGRRSFHGARFTLGCWHRGRDGARGFPFLVDLQFREKNQHTKSDMTQAQQIFFVNFTVFSGVLFINFFLQGMNILTQPDCVRVFFVVFRISTVRYPRALCYLRVPLETWGEILWLSSSMLRYHWVCWEHSQFVPDGSTRHT